jgi:hypothetical protein
MSSSSRKSVKIRPEELLAFNYERHQPSVLSSGAHHHHWRRHSGATVPFRKERYLQANYRFRISSAYESGQLERTKVAHADQLLDWALVEQVCLFAYDTYDCPICLESVVVP